ncbi:MAG TPA: hypothetical protein VML54_04730 [Candidatus Limnocylindrales bacterium]|nr:hypothetical protein [Candidatus Limnocylindrales bacterium]
MAFEEVRYEVDEGVLTLTLDRPEKLNALSSTMLAELMEDMPPFFPWGTDRPFTP